MSTEKWVADAIAEQEDYILRFRSCNGVVGKSHQFETFRGPDSAVPVPNEVTWSQCINCDATASREDFAIKAAAQGGAA